MALFKLPDLGEGLQDAEIIEWYIKPGCQVQEDQLLVSVETAKAIIDIPAPFSGTLVKTFFQAGDSLDIGQPLAELTTTEEMQKKESTSVVGEIAEMSDDIGVLHQFIIGSGENNGASLSSKELEAYRNNQDSQVDKKNPKKTANKGSESNAYSESLTGVQKSMAKNIANSQQVIQVSIFEDANIDHWPSDEDITLRLILALSNACQCYPKFNARYDAQNLSLQYLTQINLAIAVDSEHGLFAPVLRNLEKRSADDLIQGLDRLKSDVESRSIPASELIGGSIALSNFGSIFGRYATALVMPPMVAILAAGSCRYEVRAVTGNKFKNVRVLPLSLSFDHRPITGGEAARFIRKIVEQLEK